MIWAFLILTAWNIGNAIHDAARIKKHKSVSHEANAILYCVLIAFLSFQLNVWPYIPAMFCLRPLVFDNALNLLRGLKLSYTSPNPSSVIDKFERKLFGFKDWGLSNFFYLAFLITNIIVVNLVT